MHWDITKHLPMTPAAIQVRTPPTSLKLVVLAREFLLNQGTHVLVTTLSPAAINYRHRHEPTHRWQQSSVPIDRLHGDCCEVFCRVDQCRWGCLRLPTTGSQDVPKWPHKDTYGSRPVYLDNAVHSPKKRC